MAKCDFKRRHYRSKNGPTQNVTAHWRTSPRNSSPPPRQFKPSSLPNPLVSAAHPSLKPPQSKPDWSRISTRIKPNLDENQIEFRRESKRISTRIKTNLDENQNESRRDSQAVSVGLKPNPSHIGGEVQCIYG